MTADEVIKEYYKKFKELPQFNGSRFDEPYPIIEVLEAIELGVKIKEPELPQDVRA